MKKFKLNLLLILMITIMTAFIPNSASAVLKADGVEEKQVRSNYNNFMVDIRKMESLGGAMGLNETIKEDLTANSECSSKLA